jgi:hypothetical protein
MRLLGVTVEDGVEAAVFLAGFKTNALTGQSLIVESRLVDAVRIRPTGPSRAGRSQLSGG